MAVKIKGPKKRFLHAKTYSATGLNPVGEPRLFIVVAKSKSDAALVIEEAGGTIHTLTRVKA